MDGLVNVTEPELPSGWKIASLDDPLERTLFKRWLDKFERSAAGSTAFLALKEKLAPIPPGDFVTFRDQVLYACFCAERYSQYRLKPSTHNPGELRLRREDADFYLEDFKRIRLRAGRREKHTNVLEDALNGVPNWPYKDQKALLKIIEDRLQTERDQADAAINSGRRWVACLAYGREVGQNQFPVNEAEFGLILHLYLLIQCWTRTDSHNRLDIGDGGIFRDFRPGELPRCYYPEIARLVAAVLKNKTWPADKNKKSDAIAHVGNTCRKVRRDYPDAKIIGWPILTAEQTSAETITGLP